MRIISKALGVALVMTSGMALADGQTATAVDQQPKYTTEWTHLSVLLADPSARAVLNKYIPVLISSEERVMQGEDMSLKELQIVLKPYPLYGTVISDDVRAKIDQEFANLK